MSKRNEDSVERFFRKAVNQYDNSFLTEDWQKMEKLLDREAAKRAVIRSRNYKRAAISGGSIGVIALLLYFLAFDEFNPETRLATDNSKRITQAADGLQGPESANTEKVGGTAALPVPGQKSETIQQEDQSRSIQIQRKPETSPDSKTVAKNESSVNGNTGIMVGDENSRTKNSVSVANENVSTNTDGDHEETGARVKNSRNNPGNSYIEQVKINLPAEKTNTPSQMHSEAEKDKQHVVSDTDDRKVTDKEISVEKVIEPEQLIAVKNKESEEEPGKELNEKEKKQMAPSRWNIALAIAPDFSTTRISRYGTPGEAYGFFVAYRFSNRFAISSGVVKSSKKYTGDGSDYQPPEGYWQRRTNGIIPNSIVGQCEVVEIPLTIQYSAFEREKFRVYVSGGLSSYLMLSEQYTYQFEQANPGAAQGWESKEASSHRFSIGHLSIGYEHRITSRLAVGIEPFFKVPFTGIGWSQLDLFTTGAYFSIRYRILQKQKVQDTN